MKGDKALVKKDAPTPRIMVSYGEDAIRRAQEGILADAEARQLVTTTFSLSKMESASIDLVVGSPHTDYNCRGDFIRHAIVELLRRWAESGFPDQYVDDMIAHIRTMRNAAHRQRVRHEFAEALTSYEQSLTAGAETGDWQLVLGTLRTLQGFVDRTPDAYWREHLRRVVSQNPAVQHAISALYEASRVEDKLVEDAEAWERWLENLGS